MYIFFNYNYKMSCCPNNSESRNDSTVFNYMYSPLKNLTVYECNPNRGPQSCLCRWNNERTNFDKMQYNWYVHNEQPHIPGNK